MTLVGSKQIELATNIKDVQDNNLASNCSLSFKKRATPTVQTTRRGILFADGYVIMMKQQNKYNFTPGKM